MDEFRRKPVNRLHVSRAPLQRHAPTSRPDARPEAQIRVAAEPVTEQPIPKEPAQSISQQSAKVSPIAPQPLTEQPGIQSATKPRKSRKKILLGLIAGFIGVILIAVAGLFVWYNAELAPVDASNKDKKLVTIKSGSTPDAIASQLKEAGLVRNSTAFLFYTRIEGVQNNLQAGTYRLSPSESTQEITSHLTSGKVDSFNIRFLPGATLADNRQVFIDAGYSEAEVDAAFAKNYESPLFEGRPAGMDLEGYIYGETYSFATDTTVEAILAHVFEQFYGVVKENNLITLYQAQGLTLYQGITLASIVQREASPGGSDMPQIAQVFHSRLALGMQLGSDVTYQYAADKAGVPRDTNLDSPYNTRRYTGLPPGPIAAPGKKALVAVANPAPGDYLFFLSGDDDVTYYGRTDMEHQANIRNHCQEKCKII